jgi:hypothetical protein
MTKKKTNLEKKFEECDYERRKLERRAGDWRIGFFCLLLFFFGSICFVISMSGIRSVDENSFCRNLIEENYPEYIITDVIYSSGYCHADVVRQTDQRDGLSISDTIEIEFKIINDDYIKYLRSDDWVIFTLAFMVIFVSVIIILVLDRWGN